MNVTITKLKDQKPKKEKDLGELCLNVDRNYMKKKSENQFAENQEKYMAS